VADDRSVVVTGAAQGIGLAIARHFALGGARVSMIDIDAARLHGAVGALRAQGLSVEAFVADVADAESLHRAAADVADAAGACDVLASNAGVLLRGAVDDDDGPERWRRTMGVNLDGYFHAVRAFLPQLRRTRGCVVAVASIHAFVAVRNSAAYTASKGGVKQLTQALALELGPEGIRVNAVAPGLTATDMTHDTRSDPRALAAFLARVPLERTVRPEDVAHAVAFLASEGAACITGVTLPVDGGYCAT
jgi:NAD(P)-dependent dehydrogenase (short-subunit alcohol dehydrogenase family)